MRKFNLSIYLSILSLILIFIISAMILIDFLPSKNKENYSEIVSKKQENIVIVEEVEKVIPTNIQEREEETKFLLMDNDGYISIYVIDENGKKYLREKTQIVVRYLPKLDKEKLKEGIVVKGREELNKLLEDYE